jgi:UDP-glucose 4-epimerase
MHALVTGGAGFIGSHLSKKLIELGSKVTIVDNLSTGRDFNVPMESDFRLIDITTNEFTSNLPKTITHVFHLAAQSSGEISFEDPLYDIQTNTISTLELLKWSLKNKVKKFIFASSMNVYGQVNDKPINEDSLVNPESFYGVGKTASENYIKIFADLGLNSTILRLFNVYGPGQNLDNLKQGMLSIYIAYLLKNKPVLVKGSLERFRDFVYIDDVVDSFIKSIDYNKNNDIFNICTGTRTSVKEALDALFVIFKKPNYKIINKGETPRDQFGIYGSNDKAKNLLGWHPQINLNQGLLNIYNFIKTMEKE